MKARKQKIKHIEPVINTDSPRSLVEAGRQDRFFDYFAVCVLIAIGIYQSYVLFGHKVVPISDFSAFIRIGREILSFKCPSDFKRAL